MIFFKRKYTLKRFSEPVTQEGYIYTPYTLLTLSMDVQTPKKASNTDGSGSDSVQELKVFCDDEIFCDDSDRNIKGDQLWFQGKWFYCKASRLSENTVLRHWTCTFIECLEQDEPPTGDTV